MNIETEKILIINEIKNIREEWVVKAIKKILDIDYEAEVNEAHQQVLNERIAFYEANPFGGFRLGKGEERIVE